jgi:hypothetical protein
MENKIPMANIQLPAEVVANIQRGSLIYAASSCNEMVARLGFQAGATEYATKLHAAMQMLFRLTSLVNADKKPDEKFLTEIKTFLDGTK